MKRILFYMSCCFALVTASCSKSEPEVRIIPEPDFINILGGDYQFSSVSPIFLGSDNPDLALAGKYFQERILKSSGLNLDLELNPNAGKGIYLSLGDLDFSDNPEAYKLNVSGNGIRIVGNSPRGVFYGIQSLLQLLPPEVFGNEAALSPEDLVVAKVEIRDVPRYSWRGMHLDVGRHIYPVEFIKKYIDMIAMHKMNVFHWHLTEDQGWRIEIKKYPLLTEIGSIRKTADGGTYGGFYTQEEIKDVVEYARTRFVDVMPEIELPGHSVAALAAYPQLSCTGGPFEVRTAWGVSEDVYCAGKEETFEFLENVLSEVVDLFPFEFFHIGGDECPKVRWEECADCQARMKAEGLENEHELQSWFIRRIEKFLDTKDRRLVGWDEILEGGLPPKATVMSWRGIKGGIQAAQENHDVIMTPNSHLYFDYYQGDPKFEPKAIGGFLPMEKVYSYEPTPESLTGEEAEHILGAQGNVWTEYIPDEDQVEYMAAPRISALAEVVWSPKEKRDYELFLLRMKTQYLRLDAMDVNYRIPVPVVSNSSLVFLREMTLELHKAVDGAKILFTTDGTDPKTSGQEYVDPLLITQDTRLKAVIQMPSGHTSSTLDIELDQQELIEGMDIERQAGVSYALYKGQFSSVDDFKDLKPDEFGSMDKPMLKPDFPEAFGLIIRGYLNIERAGIYKFYTLSDDGSVLKIRGQAVVENDGPHAPNEKSGEMALGQGWHPFELCYFQAGGGSVLEISYSSEEFDKQSIPEDNLANFSSAMKMTNLN
jgi:hexosaminidase